ncbi:MAG: hypothetical protein COA57_14730 [Flavobacteriales bacterium]|nr:MAG: hypothetical protein COA57_14730 [Flavobacteriales bacterium]
MTLAEMATEITENIGRTDSTTLAFAKRKLDLAYRLLWQSREWRDTLMSVTITLAEDSANTGQSFPEVVLPAMMEYPIVVRTSDNIELTPDSLLATYQTDPAAFDRIADPVSFAKIKSTGTSFRMPAAGIDLTVSAVGSGDTTKKLFIRGEYNGQEKREEITLSTSTQLTGFYDFIDLVNKEITLTDVTITENTNSGTDTLLAHETELSCPRIHVHTIPTFTTGDATVYYCIGKRKFPRMVLDQDQPMIRGLEAAIMAYAEADMWKKFKNFSKRDALLQEASGKASSLADGEENQLGGIRRIIPSMAYAGHYTTDDFGM